MKKFFFGMTVLLSVSLVLAGCGNPETGDPGSTGSSGKNVGSVNTDVDAAYLAALFKAADIVTLGPSVASVDGIVPAGKKLAVSGTTKVKDGALLEVKGSVEVYEGATLIATGASGTAGFVYGAAGSVSGDGTVALLYYSGTDAVTEMPLIYNNSTAKNKAVGSVITDTGITEITAGDIESLFKAATAAPDTLTVYNLTGIVSTTVPASKTLTLLGAGNTITAALDLSSAGTLIVKEGAALNASTYSVKGVTNNGTIASSTTTAASAKDLLGLSGSGEVVFSDSVNLSSETSTLELKQNVVISGGKTLTAPIFAGAAFSGGKTITVNKGNTLALAAAVTSIGATVENDGTITTATVAYATLEPIISVGGAITASEAITDFPADFEVPEGVDLTAAGALDSVTDLTVNGKLTASSATLKSEGAKVTVGERGSATLGGTIPNLLANSSVAAGGKLTAVVTTIGNGTTDTLAVGAGAEVNGIKFPGATTISALAANALTIGNLTVPAGKTLTVGNGKTLTVGSLILTGAAGTGGAKLAGEGKVVAAKTEITGGASGEWQAVGTGTVTIAATNANASSITASAATAVLTATAAGATITQTAGASNTLTIAANTTVALGGDTTNALGTIVLDANTDPGKLSLADTTSKVLIGAGTGGNNASAITTITIGGKSVTSTGFVAADYQTVGTGTLNLVQIGGTTAGTLSAGTTDGDDVSIASNSAFAGS